MWLQQLCADANTPLAEEEEEEDVQLFDELQNHLNIINTHTHTKKNQNRNTHEAKCGREEMPVIVGHQQVHTADL